MAGILRTDTIQNSNTSTIITQTNSTTITIGTTGQTIALASGASQSGFGRAGSVNWDTTAKTTGFTAVSGNGYFVNTTAGAITVTLPATPSAGDIVAIADYANTSATNNITVGRNGSKIDGETIDAKIKVNGQVYTLVYVDATEGWKTVNQTFNQISTAQYVAATGGTVTTCGDYKIHTFTGPGTFTVSNAGNAEGSNSVDYLVVAGGGGAGYYYGGGGGAGGYRESVPSPAAWTASPLANPGGALPISVQGYPITVGAGGPSVPGNPPFTAPSGTPGNNSIFSTITSAGGGGGIGTDSGTQNGLPGGSGGGAGGVGSGGTGGTGNTPPVSPPQGNNGAGGTAPAGGGGGGGAGGSGGTPCAKTAGGGVASSITGSSVTRAAGGNAGPPTGQPTANGRTAYDNSGAANTGSGAGGDSGGPGPAAGGSGIVVIRYKYQ
jgi:hypothetical protein